MIVFPTFRFLLRPDLRRVVDHLVELVVPSLILMLLSMMLPHVFFLFILFLLLSQPGVVQPAAMALSLLPVIILILPIVHAEAVLPAGWLLRLLELRQLPREDPPVQHGWGWLAGGAGSVSRGPRSLALQGTPDWSWVHSVRWGRATDGTSDGQKRRGTSSGSDWSASGC